MIVLAVDPGRDKCGVAVCAPGRVLARAIVPPADLAGLVARWAAQHNAEAVIVGRATGSRPVLVALAGTEEQPILSIPVRPVDERNTTLAARRRYFHDHPPRGLRRLVPRSFQVPPEPYDDYAAVVMAEDYLEAHGGDIRSGD